MILIFAEVHTKATARKVARALLRDRVIACYTFFPVESAYWWKGKVLDDKGVLMILKTRDTNFAKVETSIKKHSGYEVPEVVAVKADKVNVPYLNWLMAETK